MAELPSQPLGYSTHPCRPRNTIASRDRNDLSFQSTDDRLTICPSPSELQARFQTVIGCSRRVSKESATWLTHTKRNSQEQFFHYLVTKIHKHIIAAAFAIQCTHFPISLVEIRSLTTVPADSLRLISLRIPERHHI